MQDLLDCRALFDYRVLFFRLRDLSTASPTLFAEQTIAIALPFTKEFQHSVLLVDMSEL